MFAWAYTRQVGEFKRLKNSQTILLIIVAIGLLLLLLLPHGASGSVCVLISLTLLPVFLFARIEPIQEDVPGHLVFPVRPPTRPSLFQRPPPILQS